MELDQFRDVDLVIDRANDSFVQKQFVSQGDYKGRTLTIQITNNGVISEVPGLTANLRWQNQSSGLTDLSAFSVLDKASSVFRLEYPEHMMTPGKVIANIQVIQNGRVTNLKEFELTVQMLAGQAVGIVEKAEFSALVAVLADANRFRTDIDTLETKKANQADLENTSSTLTNSLVKKVDKGGNEQITMPMLSQEVKVAMTGGSVAVVGPSGVNTTNVANGAITSPKLSNSFNYRTFLASGALLDVLDVNGFYLYSATSISDSPFSSGAGILENIKTDDYIIQNVTEFATGIKYFRTVRQSVSRVTEWVSSEIKNSSISRSKLSSDFDSKGNFQDVDLNSLIDSGTYLLIGNTSNGPVGFNGSLLLTVQKNGQWIHQTLSLLQNPSQKAYRYHFTTGNLWGEWEIASNKPLSGKVVVNFGDSLFGNTQGASSVSNVISNVTGAVVYNCGFGGCRMAGGQEIEAWQSFSMFRLSDEIVKENDDPTKWNLQDAAVNNEKWNNKPTYFENTLSVLKGIDFNSVDFITIAYGTNDYTGGNLIDDESNPLNTDTFSGALRYSLEKIMAKYKHLKILICTPTYRLWFNPDGSVESDSDTRDYARSGVLTEYVNKTIEIAKEFKIPVLDNYFELGVNKYNALEFFTISDGTHHNDLGRKKMGEKIGSALITQF
ncbi:MAG: SGNH/GDSL hydrolase family protein [Enterococcus gallinarum]|nr:SGNH/GDSL hydrolase family protein [Enterococcus gallinarum]MDY4071038.1 SGNH/GDSL hydrolase family protein [Enterococcus gallinarum]